MVTGAGLGHAVLAGVGEPDTRIEVRAAEAAQHLGTRFLVARRLVY